MPVFYTYAKPVRYEIGNDIVHFFSIVVIPTSNTALINSDFETVDCCLLHVAMRVLPPK